MLLPSQSKLSFLRSGARLRARPLRRSNPRRRSLPDLFSVPIYGPFSCRRSMPERVPPLSSISVSSFSGVDCRRSSIFSSLPAIFRHHQHSTHAVSLLRFDLFYCFFRHIQSPQVVEDENICQLRCELLCFEKQALCQS